MKHILLAADVMPHEELGLSGPVLSQYVLRDKKTCDIRIRYYEVENHRIAVVDFKARRDGAVDLFNVTYMPPTSDDLAYVEQILSGRLQVVNTEGSADGPSPDSL